MITWTLALAWGALASWYAFVPPALVARLRAARPGRRTASRPGRASDLPAALGRAVLRGLDRAGVVRPDGPRGWAQREGFPDAVGWATIGAGAGLALLGPPGLMLGAVPLSLRARFVRRRRARVERDLNESLPEVIDLLGLVVGAGLTVTLAVDAVAARATGPVADRLREAAHTAKRQGRLADALDDMAGQIGPRARPLFGALAASERYGVPLGPTLERLAAEARSDHRRRAEERARRVPILLLFPLVLCVLPAFALLTVAPLIAGALESLRLG